MEENTNTNLGNENQENKEVKTYTQEEVDALLQQETDRRISSAQKKWEKKSQEKVREAEKLAKLSEQERFQYELEQREKAIAEKEKQMALMENKAEASKALNERGISIALADFVVAEDADSMMENIKVLEEEFKKSVKAEVEKRLAGNSPKKNLGDSKGMTREEFRKLSFARQTELLNENPDIYEKFFD